MSCFCRRALKICRWKIVSLVLIARYVCCMDPTFEKYPKTALGRVEHRTAVRKIEGSTLRVLK